MSRRWRLPLHPSCEALLMEVGRLRSEVGNRDALLVEVARLRNEVGDLKFRLAQQAGA